MQKKHYLLLDRTLELWRECFGDDVHCAATGHPFEAGSCSGEGNDQYNATTMCHWSETDWCQTFQEWSWQQQLQMHLLRKNVPTMKCMERPMGAMGYGWEISWDMVDAGQKRRTTGFGDLLVTETILKAWSHGRNHAGYSMVVAYIWTSTGRLENDQDPSLTAIKFIVCIYRIIVSEECV